MNGLEIHVYVQQSELPVYIVSISMVCVHPFFVINAFFTDPDINDMVYIISTN